LAHRKHTPCHSTFAVNYFRDECQERIGRERDRESERERLRETQRDRERTMMASVEK
jgi:hypothetical protein